MKYGASPAASSNHGAEIVDKYVCLAAAKGREPTKCSSERAERPLMRCRETPKLQEESVDNDGYFATVQSKAHHSA